MKRLEGLRIGVTRSRSQASTLAALLRDEGAIPVELPVLAFHDPPSWDPLDDAMAAWRADPEAFDALALTSVNAVERALRRAPDLAHSKALVAVVGRATAEACRAHGLTPDVIPDRASSEGLLEALERLDALPRRWLIPRALEARGVLEAELRRQGADVTVAPVYRTAPPDDPTPLQAAFAAGVDILTFCSGSAVTNLRAALGGTWPAGIADVTIASIGPITTTACHDAGLTVHIEAPTPRLVALVSAIVQHQEPR